MCACVYACMRVLYVRHLPDGETVGMCACMYACMRVLYVRHLPDGEMVAAAPLKDRTSYEGIDWKAKADVQEAEKRHVGM